MDQIYQYLLLRSEAEKIGIPIPLGSFFYPDMEFVSYGINRMSDASAIAWIQQKFKQEIESGQITYTAVKIPGGNTLIEFIDGQWETDQP